MALIGLDARSVFRNSTRGIGNYLYHLLEAMHPATDHRFRLYYELQSGPSPFPSTETLDSRQLRIRGSRLYTWEQWALPQALRQDRVDLYHATANTLPWYQPCKTVVTIHDVLLARIDDDETGSFLFYWRQVLPRCLKKADHIITVSDYSRQDLLNLWNLDPSRVTTIYSGRDPYYQPLDESALEQEHSHYPNLPQRFIFLLGAQAPRKNTLRTIRAYQRLRRDTDLQVGLVVTGLQATAQKQLRTMITSDPRAEDIHLYGFVEKPFLRYLYNTAELFVYPSLYEGFGFPMLEAMACGTPVVASDRTSLPEVAADAARYCDPEDEDSIATAMQEVITNQTLRTSLIRRGAQRIKQFDWSTAARRYLDIYDTVLGCS